MAKLTLSDLSNLNNQTAAVNTINNNSDLIEAAMENTLSRDGTSPNEMNAVLDMNSNRIINLPDAASEHEPVTLRQVLEGVEINPYPSDAIVWAVDSVAELKLIDPIERPTVNLKASGRSGIFFWLAGDRSSSIAADPQEGVFIESDIVASTSGCWVRQEILYTSEYSIKWFGAPSGGDDTPLFQAALALSNTIYAPAGVYQINTPLTIPSSAVLRFEKNASYTFSGTGSITRSGVTSEYSSSGSGRRFIQRGPADSGLLFSNTPEGDGAESRFGVPVLVVNSPGNQNAFVGATTNRTAPGTLAFPTGVTGYGANYSDGGTAFGIYAEAMAFANGCVTNEIDSFNYHGAPVITYPPARSFGIDHASPIALTLGASGDYVSTMAIHVVPGGIDPISFWDGIYFNPNSVNNSAIFVDANTTDSPVSSAILKNNHDASGNSNLFLQHVGGAAVAGSTFINCVGPGGGKLFSIDSDGWPHFAVANIQGTVGAAGLASALPANPSGYAKIRVNNVSFVVPYYLP